MQQIEDRYKYSSVDVAFLIAAMANEQKYYINLTKIQKLLYIVYGAYLRLHGERIVDEHPQAWPYGPVFPNTRKVLLKVEDLSTITIEDVDENVRNDETLKSIITFVFDEFAKYTAGELTEWSHAEGSPWDKTTKRKGFEWGDCISDYDILDYFKQIIDVGDEEE